MCVRFQLWTFENTSKPVGFETPWGDMFVLVSGDDKSTYIEDGTSSDHVPVSYLKWEGLPVAFDSINQFTVSEYYELLALSHHWLPAQWHQVLLTQPCPMSTGLPGRKLEDPKTHGARHYRRESSLLKMMLPLTLLCSPVRTKWIVWMLVRKWRTVC